jgi:phenylpropionate dioxygenase-like ring-hydroxylating dioxygenase large terminal subunit
VLLSMFVGIEGQSSCSKSKGATSPSSAIYHAWTYGLDGSLRMAPGSNYELGFEKHQLSLYPVQVERWGPFIFVNPDSTAPSLAAILGDLPVMVENTGLNLDQIHRRIQVIYDIAANWKVVVDNYLECYHCPMAHPSFTALIDLHSYELTVHDYFSTQCGKVRESAKEGKKTHYNICGGVEDGFYAFVWPNFTINIYPGPGNVSLNLFVPISPSQPRAIYEYCFVDTVADDEVQAFNTFVDQIQREDIALCESVQRGLQSGYFEQGRLMLIHEKGLQHFQKLVYRFLTA